MFNSLFLWLLLYVMIFPSDTTDMTLALLILFPKYLEFPFLVSLTFILEHFLNTVFGFIMGPSAVLSLMG